MVLIWVAMQKQNKVMSLIESITNVVAGYFVAVGSQIVLYPVFGIHITIGENLLLASWFTLISLIRSYILRRIFNKF